MSPYGPSRHFAAAQQFRRFWREADIDWQARSTDHQRLTLATEVDVYFCDPRCPWQRGSNENTNRLLRQYLPRRKAAQ
jgi:hypothetical protein